MKITKNLFLKLNILMIAILIIALKILPEFRIYILVATGFAIIVVLFSLKNRLISIKIKKYYIKSFILLFLAGLLSLSITSVFQKIIPIYFNISHSSPTYISEDDLSFFKNLKQPIHIIYLSSDNNNEILFKNLMYKINKINKNITYKVLRPIINDTEYFKLRKNYPAFVMGSMLVIGRSFAQVSPNFNKKIDIINTIRALNGEKRNICIYGDSTENISILTRILKTSSYKIQFIPPIKETCDTTILYDKLSNKLSKTDIKHLLELKQLIIFTTNLNHKNIKGLLDKINIHLKTCSDMLSLAEYSDIHTYKINNFTIHDTGNTCINDQNTHYKKVNNIKLISSNIIDNRLIEFGDNAKLILALLSQKSESINTKKSPLRAISPRGLNILLYILSIWFLLIF